MVIWRISNHTDLSGAGGIRSSGRRHHHGAPVVYLAENPALAMLEVLVNFELAPGEVPGAYMLLEVEFPDDRSIHLLHDSELPEGWREHRAFAQGIGGDRLLGGTRRSECGHAEKPPMSAEPGLSGCRRRGDQVGEPGSVRPATVPSRGLNRSFRGLSRSFHGLSRSFRGLNRSFRGLVPSFPRKRESTSIMKVSGFPLSRE